MSALHRAALEYARRGWPVFPCWPRGKNPRLAKGGHKNATADPEQVADWWDRWPDANIGCPPGRAGVVVLDWDCEEGRREAIRLGLYSEPTLIVGTARGEHIYGNHPGFPIGNRKISGVLDVRADKGYVLLPPSIHPSGAIYRAHGKLDGVRDLPSQVVELLRTPKREAPAHANGAGIAPPIDADSPRRRARVRAAIEAACMMLATTGEGSRNDALNTAAFSLARFVLEGVLHPGALADILTFTARHSGLEDHEIERTIRSAFRARGIAA